MRVGLLGPLRVVTVEGTADIRAPQQPVLIANLAVHVGMVVYSEQLAAAIWGDPPPARWRQALPPLRIRRLRVSLGAEDALIVTSSPGYRLDVEPRRVDIWGFDALRKDGLAAALADDWEQASQDPDRGGETVAGYPVRGH